MSTVSRRSPFSSRQAGEPGAQIGLHVDLARRLDQQPPAVAAADDGDRRLGRPQHLDAFRPAARGGRSSRANSSASSLSRAETTSAASRPYGGSMPAWRWRISRSRNASRSPEMIACITGCSGMCVCTKPRPCAQRAAGAARHLMQQLERALAGARVGALREAEIAVDDADRSRGRGSGGPWPRSACR